MDNQWQALIDDMKTGSIRALTRLITRVENRDPGWMEAMKGIFPDTGNAQIVGITGSPGVGKSTLTNRFTRILVKRNYRVGIIAVDPSSPFSGGAILGDRARMTDISNLEGVFVRSMATRGVLGGLSQSARDAAKILDAFGKDIILIETVGVGQDEIEVVKAADVVLVICIPGQGDGLQAIKAGIMEIGDLFVVNKADLPEADQVVMDIQVMLELDMHADRPGPAILKTIATKGEGIDELVDCTLDLLGSVDRNSRWQEKRIKEEILGLAEKELMGFLKNNWQKDGRWDETVKQIMQGEKDPYTVVQEMLSTIRVPSV